MSLIENKVNTRNYDQLLVDIQSLIKGEDNLLANMGNILAALKYSMNWFWVGLYKVEGEELVLFLFQGPYACTRIQKGKGVCGIAWQENRTIIVDDVNTFEGHISCNVASKSEIVIPIRNKEGAVVLILDIDSDLNADFTEKDAIELQKIASVIEQLI